MDRVVSGRFLRQGEHYKIICPQTDYQTSKLRGIFKGENTSRLVNAQRVLGDSGCPCSVTLLMSKHLLRCPASLIWP